MEVLVILHQQFYNKKTTTNKQIALNQVKILKLMQAHDTNKHESVPISMTNECK